MSLHGRLETVSARCPVVKAAHLVSFDFFMELGVLKIALGQAVGWGATLFILDHHIGPELTA